MEVVEVGKKANRPIINNFRRLLYIVIFFGVIILLINLRVSTKYWQSSVSLDEVPDHYGTAIVFGAGLKSRGVPGLILQDRVMKAIELYQNGKVDKILLSGDNQSPAHNEVVAMKNLALQEGLSEDVLLLDHSGLSTYQTCENAITDFGLTRAVIVTQKYHLKRAVYDCGGLGLEVLGVDATENYYGVMNYQLREVLARVSDWFKVMFK